jgi:predicted O-methyltransferase YrrM
VTQEQWNAVDGYINQLFVESDDALTAALDASAEANLPPIQVPPNGGKFLNMLARMVGARRILEVGTLGGYSTIWLARALPPDGELITLEIDQTCAEVARANVDRAGLSDLVEVKLGSAHDTMPALEGPFDFIFIDADKVSYPEYFAYALELSRPGTLIVADNVVRDGAIVDADSDDANVQGVRRFNELVAAEPRVTATAIQTVGIKGYDGFAVVLVTR